MTRHFPLRSARQEVKSAKSRHLQILKDIRTHAVTNNPAKVEFLFLMSIPMIYAAWEGYFRLAISLCLKRRCFIGRKASKYDKQYAALWLQKESFFDSFLGKLVSSMQLGRPAKRISSGKFTAVSEFTHNMRDWLNSPISHLSNFDEFVMTYSNVNKDVTSLNSNIVGLDITQVDFSRLDELLSRRNDIAHGGIINYPRESTVVELLDYTENLITTFHQSVEDWLAKS